MHIADEVIVRVERSSDHPQIDRILEAAFGATNVASKVSAIRGSDAFIPELSLVGEVCERIVGHVMLTPVSVDSSVAGTIDAGDVLALGPVAVLPPYQRKGIGLVLVRSALRFAHVLGMSGIVVAGPAAYFKRAGFQPAAQFGLMAGFDIPKESFLAHPLRECEFASKTGVVRYQADLYPLS